MAGMIFINGNNTPRIARIDLTTFETVEIIEIPNYAGVTTARHSPRKIPSTWCPVPALVSHSAKGCAHR